MAALRHGIRNFRTGSPNSRILTSYVVPSKEFKELNSTKKPSDAKPLNNNNENSSKFINKYRDWDDATSSTCATVASETRRRSLSTPPSVYGFSRPTTAPTDSEDDWRSQKTSEASWRHSLNRTPVIRSKSGRQHGFIPSLKHVARKLEGLLHLKNKNARKESEIKSHTFLDEMKKGTADTLKKCLKSMTSLPSLPVDVTINVPYNAEKTIHIVEHETKSIKSISVSRLNDGVEINGNDIGDKEPLHLQQHDLLSIKKPYCRLKPIDNKLTEENSIIPRRENRYRPYKISGSGATVISACSTFVQAKGSSEISVVDLVNLIYNCNYRLNSNEANKNGSRLCLNVVQKRCFRSSMKRCNDGKDVFLDSVDLAAREYYGGVNSRRNVMRHRQTDKESNGDDSINGNERLLIGFDGAQPSKNGADMPKPLTFLDAVIRNHEFILGIKLSDDFNYALKRGFSDTPVHNNADLRKYSLMCIEKKCVSLPALSASNNTNNCNNNNNNNCNPCTQPHHNSTAGHPSYASFFSSKKLLPNQYDEMRKEYSTANGFRSSFITDVGKGIPNEVLHTVLMNYLKRKTHSKEDVTEKKSNKRVFEIEGVQDNTADDKLSLVNLNGDRINSVAESKTNSTFFSGKKSFPKLYEEMRKEYSTANGFFSQLMPDRARGIPNEVLHNVLMNYLKEKGHYKEDFAKRKNGKSICEKKAMQDNALDSNLTQSDLNSDKSKNILSVKSTGTTGSYNELAFGLSENCGKNVQDFSKNEINLKECFNINVPSSIQNKNRMDSSKELVQIFLRHTDMISDSIDEQSSSAEEELKTEGVTSSNAEEENTDSRSDGPLLEDNDRERQDEIMRKVIRTMVNESNTVSMDEDKKKNVTLVLENIQSLQLESTVEIDKPDCEIKKEKTPSQKFDQVLRLSSRDDAEHIDKYVSVDRNDSTENTILNTMKTTSMSSAVLSDPYTRRISERLKDQTKISRRPTDGGEIIEKRITVLGLNSAVKDSPSKEKMVSYTHPWSKTDNATGLYGINDKLFNLFNDRRGSDSLNNFGLPKNKIKYEEKFNDRSVMNSTIKKVTDSFVRAFKDEQVKYTGGNKIALKDKTVSKSLVPFKDNNNIYIYKLRDSTRHEQPKSKFGKNFEGIEAEISYTYLKSKEVTQLPDKSASLFKKIKVEDVKAVVKSVFAGKELSIIPVTVKLEEKPLGNTEIKLTNITEKVKKEEIKKDLVDKSNKSLSVVYNESKFGGDEFKLNLKDKDEKIFRQENLNVGKNDTPDVIIDHSSVEKGEKMYSELKNSSDKVCSNSANVNIDRLPCISGTTDVKESVNEEKSGKTDADIIMENLCQFYNEYEKKFKEDTKSDNYFKEKEKLFNNYVNSSFDIKSTINKNLNTIGFNYSRPIGFSVNMEKKLEDGYLTSSHMEYFNSKYLVTGIEEKESRLESIDKIVKYDLYKNKGNARLDKSRRLANDEIKNTSNKKIILSETSENVSLKVENKLNDPAIKTNSKTEKHDSLKDKESLELKKNLNEKGPEKIVDSINMIKDEEIMEPKEKVSSLKDPYNSKNKENIKFQETVSLNNSMNLDISSKNLKKLTGNIERKNTVSPKMDRKLPTQSNNIKVKENMVELNLVVEGRNTTSGLNVQKNESSTPDENTTSIKSKNQDGLPNKDKGSKTIQKNIPTNRQEPNLHSNDHKANEEKLTSQKGSSDKTPDIKTTKPTFQSNNNLKNTDNFKNTENIFESNNNFKNTEANTQKKNGLSVNLNKRDAFTSEPLIKTDTLIENNYPSIITQKRNLINRVSINVPVNLKETGENMTRSEKKRKAEKRNQVTKSVLHKEDVKNVLKSSPYLVNSLSNLSPNLLSDKNKKYIKKRITGNYRDIYNSSSSNNDRFLRDLKKTRGRKVPLTDDNIVKSVDPEPVSKVTENLEKSVTRSKKKYEIFEPKMKDAANKGLIQINYGNYNSALNIKKNLKSNPDVLNKKTKGKLMDTTEDSNFSTLLALTLNSRKLINTLGSKETEPNFSSISYATIQSDLIGIEKHQLLKPSRDTILSLVNSKSSIKKKNNRQSEKPAIVEVKRNEYINKIKIEPKSQKNKDNKPSAIKDMKMNEIDLARDERADGLVLKQYLRQGRIKETHETDLKDKLSTSTNKSLLQNNEPRSTETDGNKYNSSADQNLNVENNINRYDKTNKVYSFAGRPVPTKIATPEPRPIYDHKSASVKLEELKNRITAIKKENDIKNSERPNLDKDVSHYDFTAKINHAESLYGEKAKPKLDYSIVERMSKINPEKKNDERAAVFNSFHSNIKERTFVLYKDKNVKDLFKNASSTADLDNSYVKRQTTINNLSSYATGKEVINLGVEIDSNNGKNLSPNKVSQPKLIKTAPENEIVKKESNKKESNKKESSFRKNSPLSDIVEQAEEGSTMNAFINTLKDKTKKLFSTSTLIDHLTRKETPVDSTKEPQTYSLNVVNALKSIGSDSKTKMPSDNRNYKNVDFVTDDINKRDRKEPFVQSKSLKDSRKEPLDHSKSFADSYNEPFDQSKSFAESHKEPHDSSKSLLESRKEAFDQSKSFLESRKEPFDSSKFPVESRKEPFDNLKSFADSHRESFDESKKFTDSRKEQFDKSRPFAESRKEPSNQSKLFAKSHKEPIDRLKSFAEPRNNLNDKYIDGKNRERKDNKKTDKNLPPNRQISKDKKASKDSAIKNQTKFANLAKPKFSQATMSKNVDKSKNQSKTTEPINVDQKIKMATKKVKLWVSKNDVVGNVDYTKSIDRSNSQYLNSLEFRQAGKKMLQKYGDNKTKASGDKPATKSKIPLTTVKAAIIKKVQSPNTDNIDRTSNRTVKDYLYDYRDKTMKNEIVNVIKTDNKSASIKTKIPFASKDRRDSKGIDRLPNRDLKVGSDYRLNLLENLRRKESARPKTNRIINSDRKNAIGQKQMSQAGIAQATRSEPLRHKDIIDHFTSHRLQVPTPSKKLDDEKGDQVMPTSAFLFAKPKHRNALSIGNKIPSKQAVKIHPTFKKEKTVLYDLYNRVKSNSFVKGDNHAKRLPVPVVKNTDNLRPNRPKTNLATRTSASSRTYNILVPKVQTQVGGNRQPSNFIPASKNVGGHHNQMEADLLKYFKRDRFATTQASSPKKMKIVSPVSKKASSQNQKKSDKAEGDMVRSAYSIKYKQSGNKNKLSKNDSAGLSLINITRDHINRRYSTQKNYHSVYLKNDGPAVETVSDVDYNRLKSKHPLISINSVSGIKSNNGRG